MVTSILWALAAIVAIPVALVVLWHALRLVLALICDAGGIIFSIILVAVIAVIVVYLI